MTVRRSETVDATRAEAFRGTFAPMHAAMRIGAGLPPGWEGVYFPFAAALSDLRADGTPARDGVIPEIDLPRRMYAGEDTRFVQSIEIGDVVEQVASLGEVTEKSNASGRLVFVDVVREFRVSGELALQSVWHDVFLPPTNPGVAPRPPRRDPDAVGAADWVEEVTLDARQLFRFSALTFNTHLIHYDRAWAREVEGLPDLLVHGPLTRILLMDAARRRVDRVPRSLRVRALAPILVDRRLRLVGSTVQDRTSVIALDDDDAVCATAQIEWV